jgi:retinol dehydrogenase 12
MAAAQEDPDFDIKPNILPAVRTFLHSQLFVTPTYPTDSFTGQTIIVTGSNASLGLEAARHFFRLGAAKLILAVRNISKGEAGREDILRSVRTRTDASAIEVWLLDMSSTALTLAFAERVRAELPRVDAVVLNAGISNKRFDMAEGYELVTQVNVLNTFLLALALLPKLVETNSRFPDAEPHLSVVTSEVHRIEDFDEINAPDLFEKLNRPEEYIKQKRYQVTKLMEILLVRELVQRLAEADITWAALSSPVIINLVNPGLCNTALGRSEATMPLWARVLRRLLDRTPEVGARCYVHAAAGPADSHGEYMADGKNQEMEAWILTDVGARVQRKVWEQTVKVLERRRPGILKGVGL